MRDAGSLGWGQSGEGESQGQTQIYLVEEGTPMKADFWVFGDSLWPGDKEWGEVSSHLIGENTGAPKNEMICPSSLQYV